MFGSMLAFSQEPVADSVYVAFYGDIPQDCQGTIQACMAYCYTTEFGECNDENSRCEINVCRDYTYNGTNGPMYADLPYPNAKICASFLRLILPGGCERTIDLSTFPVDGQTIQLVCGFCTYNVFHTYYMGYDYFWIYL
jgi:hypothetical protein